MKKIAVGITGMSGFIGSHLRDKLKRHADIEVLPYEDSYYENQELLIDFIKKADVIVHLAGVNRDEPQVVYRKNIELMAKLLEYADFSGNKPYILFSSSSQIERDNEYGQSKKKAMELLEQWSEKNNCSAVSMVLPNVFGDSGRPFYNSVVATFCYQITHGEKPEIIKDNQIPLIYINDLIEDIYNLIKERKAGYNIEYIKPRAEVKVSQLLALLNKFKKSYYNNGMISEISSDFERDLYNTFISYMDQADWHRNLKLNTDPRGSFVEVFKFEKGGQVSFSTTKPGITRGNHYHIRKNEKFCVLSGQASIKLRRIGTSKVIEYNVSGDKPAWIEIPIYYTHNITNTGDSELITAFWINEHFVPDDSDTFYEEV